MREGGTVQTYLHTVQEGSGDLASCVSSGYEQDLGQVKRNVQITVHLVKETSLRQWYSELRRRILVYKCIVLFRV